MPNRLMIVAQVGAENLKSTCELAMHARSIDVDCIAVVPPTYFKPPSLGMLWLNSSSTCVYFL